MGAWDVEMASSPSASFVMESASESLHEGEADGGGGASSFGTFMGGPEVIIVVVGEARVVVEDSNNPSIENLDRFGGGGMSPDADDDDGDGDDKRACFDMEGKL